MKFQGAPVPSPDAIELARGLAYTFLYVYGVRAAAVFMIAVSTIALSVPHASLPRWLVVVGYVIAVIMLFSVSFYKLTVLLFPLWVAAVSVVILLPDRRRRSAPLAEPGRTTTHSRPARRHRKGLTNEHV